MKIKNWIEFIKNRSFLGKSAHIGVIVSILFFLMPFLFIFTSSILKKINIFDFNLLKNEQLVYVWNNLFKYSLLVFSPFYFVEAFYWILRFKKNIIRNYKYYSRKKKNIKELSQWKQREYEKDKWLIFYIIKIEYCFIFPIIYLVLLLHDLISADQTISLMFIYHLLFLKLEKLFLSIKIKGRRGINKFVCPNWRYIIYEFLEYDELWQLVKELNKISFR